MLTIMVHAKIKEDKLTEYLEIAELLTKETRGNRPGCLSYSFNQNRASPTEFVLYEQWESQTDLDNHIKELCKLLGDPAPGYPLPERLLQMYESATPIYYNEVGANA